MSEFDIHGGLISVSTHLTSPLFEGVNLLKKRLLLRKMEGGAYVYP